ncbi:MAG: elongation factor G [Eubacteriales bacterium]|nr:elongation factor G [Eubacteriales bacterium]
MKVYTTDKIRNVVLLGHGGAGKTSLVEAISYIAKLTKRLGNVVDGNTISDFGKEEQKRQISIQTSLISIEWGEYKINILDTPGYRDFSGEVEEAIRAAGGAIIVVNGKAGVEAGTKRAWDLCEKYKLPRFVYVTNMDVDNASFRQVVTDMTELYGKRMAPLNLPIRENGKFVGYVNVISQTGNRWKESEVIPCDIPEYNKENLNICRNTLIESVAETSEEMMNRYFAGEEFSEQEIRSALKFNVWDSSIVPMFMGSNTLCQGAYALMDDIIKYLPGPETREVAGVNTKTNEIFKANNDFSKTKSAICFKTMVDPFIGKYSFIKVHSGVIKTDDILYNANRDQEEKIGKIYVMQGNKTTEVKELFAGDLGVLAKLSITKTGDTLSQKNEPIQYSKIEIPKPYTAKAYIVKEKSEIDKLAQSLQKLCEEDLTIKIENDTKNHQMLIYGMGLLHLEEIQSRLLDEYKVEIIYSKPRIAFKETIRKSSDVEFKHKKQSGGHGQYGHVKMRFSPSQDFDTPYIFKSEVVGGAIPKNYFPAVEKGLIECCEKGPLCGYPVVGVNAVLYDGSYHEVDSSEMAFKMATIGAFKDGFMKASPVLLEPIANIKVEVEDKHTGDCMGDLNKRRGRVLGMKATQKGKTQIEADIPVMEIDDYSTTLRSMTGGTGDYSYEVVRYEQAPSDICEKEIEKAKNEKES